MNSNYEILRIHIEQLILSSFINQNRSLPMDEMEFRDTKLPFELFQANRTIKMIAKAIYDLQEANEPIDEDTILFYIEKKISEANAREINMQEWLEVSSRLWVSFDNMNLYLDKLKHLDEEERKLKLLEEL